MIEHGSCVNVQISSCQLRGPRSQRNSWYLTVMGQYTKNIHLCDSWSLTCLPSSIILCFTGFLYLQLLVFVLFLSMNSPVVPCSYNIRKAWWLSPPGVGNRAIFALVYCLALLLIALPVHVVLSAFFCLTTCQWISGDLFGSALTF